MPRRATWFLTELAKLALIAGLIVGEAIILGVI